MSRVHWLTGMATMMLIAAPAMSQGPDTQMEMRGGRVNPLNKPFLIGDSVLASKYWLGINCAPVTAELRSHLSLPEKQGVLILAVVKESPAAKAGLEQFDVLLRVNEKPLVEPRDLLAAVDAAKETKLKIELIRAGKPRTIELTPAKRPEQPAGAIGPGSGPGDIDDWNTVQRWMESMGAGKPGTGSFGPIQFRIVGPSGAIVPNNAIAPLSLPGNTSVAITKEGDHPAKIVVKRNNDKWELTEKDIDKLPADLRPVVERMLGHSTSNALFGIVGPSTTPAPSPGTMQFQPLPGLDPRIEKRFDEMNQRMDQLMKLMEEMSGTRTHATSPQHDEPK
jgi:membrane-associated protease RseP (regulator of RpoE activity)